MFRLKYEAVISRWGSFEEYSEWVQPVCVTKSSFRAVASSTLLEQITDLAETAYDFRQSLTELQNHGYDPSGRLHNPLDESQDAASALGICRHLCDLGERILICSRDLAKSRDASNFLHGKQYIDLYTEKSPDRRRDQWIGKLLAACHDLYSAYYNAVHNPDTFILDQLDASLPLVLKRDFISAQHQFSVGLFEQGFLSSGRGFEGVLRAFAQRKRLWIQTKSGKRPAGEASLRELIEVLSRARWRKDKSPVLSTRASSVLHFIRNSRNAVAHPATDDMDENWKEFALIAASNANKLWKLSQQRYAGLVETTISLQTQ
jgi:hypothetical protein